MAAINNWNIYNSRNYNGVLNTVSILLHISIYNSRNYNGVLNSFISYGYVTTNS